MTRIDRNLMLNALAWLIVGTLFGFWMGASNQLQYVTVHVVMVMSGFVTLAIYAVIYRLWPELKQARAAAAQFWIAVASLPLMVIGAWYFVAAGSVALIAPASAAAIVAAILMGWIFWQGTAGS